MTVRSRYTSDVHCVKAEEFAYDCGSKLKPSLARPPLVANALSAGVSTLEPATFVQPDRWREWPACQRFCIHEVCHLFFRGNSKYLPAQVVSQTALADSPSMKANTSIAISRFPAPVQDRRGRQMAHSASLMRVFTLASSELLTK